MRAASSQVEETARNAIEQIKVAADALINRFGQPDPKTMRAFASSLISLADNGGGTLTFEDASHAAAMHAVSAKEICLHAERELLGGRDPVLVLINVSLAQRLMTSAMSCALGFETEASGALALSRVARAAAAKRHAENYAMKEQVWEWYAANEQQYSSMDKAAEAAVKVVPVAVRTARKWIGEWRKGRRPIQSA